MTTIWNSTNKVNLRPNMRVPVDISAVGAPHHVVTQELTTTRNIHKLKRSRAKLAGVRAGKNNFKIMCIGDSTTAGVSDEASTTYKQNAYPEFLKDNLQNLSYTAQAGSVIGYGKTGGDDNVSTDDRVVTTGTLSQNTTGRSMGGGLMQFAASTTLAFTPKDAVDSFDVYAITGFGSTMDLDVDGGAATNVDLTAAESIVKTTISAPSLGAHTLNITVSTGTVMFICGFEGYDSTTSHISVMNVGVQSAKTGDLSVGSAKPWTLTDTWDWYGTDLVVFNLGINDWNSAVTTATYKLNIETTLDGIIANDPTIDIVLVVPNPTSTNLTAQAEYTDALYEISEAYGIPIVDLGNRFENYVDANTIGLMSDTLHPNKIGYHDISHAILNAIVDV